MIKVAKFGGSSVANAEQFRKVKAIVEADKSRKFIVTSACGKESHEDHKVTDLLYLCREHIRYGVSYEDMLGAVESKYRRIKEELGLKLDLESEFAEIRSHLDRNVSTDYLVSRGEYLTARCLAEYLDADFADAQDFIAFNFDGSFDFERIEELFSAYLNTDKKLVIPGFYGFLPNGKLKIMSRGGSDISGAVIANITNADVYENWTDVSGFMVTDPRIVKDPLPIAYLNYNELREMSYMGANVLHDDAIFPVRMKSIPINIRNTNDPENPGTMIMNDCSEYDKVNPPHAITGITGRRDYSVLTVIKSHSSAEVGFLKKILTVLEEYKISIESAPITVDTFSVLVQTKDFEGVVYDVIERIKKDVRPDEIYVEDNISLIAVVGRAMRAVPGMAGSFLAELGRNKINIKIINQGSDELSIMVGVDNKDFEKAIQCIYNKFIIEEENMKKGS
jgi:aspartate kinase